MERDHRIIYIYYPSYTLTRHEEIDRAQRDDQTETSERIKLIQLGPLHFIDSMAFLKSSLDGLMAAQLRGGTTTNHHYRDMRCFIARWGVILHVFQEQPLLGQAPPAAPGCPETEQTTVSHVGLPHEASASCFPAGTNHCAVEFICTQNSSCTCVLLLLPPAAHGTHTWRMCGCVCTAATLATAQMP